MRTIKIYNTDVNTGLMEMTGIAGTANNEEVLLEKIAKLLNTDIGSNVFSPELGSPVGNKKALSAENGSGQLEIILHEGVQNVQNLILKEQSEEGTAGMKSNQILDHLEVSRIYQDAADPTVFYVEVLVYTTSGNVYIATV